MSNFTNPLENIRIASPCSADWNEMYGDARKRFCGDCKLNVYNLSGMTRDEAENLIIAQEGSVCVRFYMRPDGTVITSDCPVGWAGIKFRTRVFATAALSVLVTLFTGVLFVSTFTGKRVTIGQINIPFVTPTPQPRVLMGAIVPRLKDDDAEPEPKKTQPPTKKVMQEVLNQVEAPIVRRVS